MFIEKKGIAYEEYVQRQGRKANNPKKRKMFIRTSPRRMRGFGLIFKKVKGDLNPGKVLCLGARTGCEVKAARAAGFEGSKGIDLHPIGDNVVKGDWHNIPFSANSFENVYTNSIDHCYDLNSLITEVRRVLKPKGKFFFQTALWQALKVKDDREVYIQGSNNFLFWDEGRDIAKKFIESGFTLVKDWADHKWENFILVVDKG